MLHFQLVRSINILLFATAVLVAGTAHAKKMAAVQVPAAAQATFKAKFPTVKTVAWEKEGTAWEAGFRQGGKTMSAVITPAGALQEVETDLEVAQLPATVRAALARDYKAYQVKEAATIVRADGSTVYEAEVSQGGKARDVLFTADGKVVSK